MRNKMMLLVMALAVFGLMTGVTGTQGAYAQGQDDKSAQDGDKDGKHNKRKHRRHAMLLKKFDKDGDGKLSDDEKAAAKEFVKAHREEWKERRQDRHKKILEKFDKDGDGKLSDDEKGAAKEARKQHREEWKKNHGDKGEGRDGKGQGGEHRKRDGGPRKGR